MSLSIAVVLSIAADAAWSIRQSTIQINSGAGITEMAGSKNYLSQTQFNKAYLGSFTEGGTFTLNGGYMHVRRTNTSNVCVGTMYYRIYKAGTAAGAWIAVSLPNSSVVDANTGKLASNAMSLDILASLTPATYFLEVYWSVTGHSTCSTCCSSTLNDFNGGSGFRGYFDYEMFDAFTDGNFTASPVWSGDATAWKFQETSAVAAGATNAKSLRFRRDKVPGTNTSVRQIRHGVLQNNIESWLGRNAQSYTTSSRVMIWLYANESNLESGTVDGYRISIGDDTGGDEFILQVVTNGVATNLITSSALTNGLTDIGVSLHVKRLTGGAWTMYTSTLPTSNGGGQTSLRR